jgi:DNA-binding response OmpR family regulator
MAKAGDAEVKIMVVEDNEMLLGVLRRVLVRAGYEVVPAANGAEMTRLVLADRPDLIVLDIALPDADGRDLLAALKKDARMATIPVVVWSGRYADSDRAVVLDLGAEDYVEKGSPSALVAKIERVLLRISERELRVARSSLDAKSRDP